MKLGCSFVKGKTALQEVADKHLLSLSKKVGSVGEKLIFKKGRLSWLANLLSVSFNNREAVSYV